MQLVVSTEKAFCELLAESVAKERVRGQLKLGFGMHGRAGSGVVEDGLEHRKHFVGSEIALTLDDFVAVAVENDSGRPAVVFVAIGKIGAGVLVGFDDDVVSLEHFDYGGVAVGVFVHDVAPVAPDGFQIEEDETLFLFGLREDGLGPWLPIEMSFGSRGGFGWNG